MEKSSVTLKLSNRFAFIHGEGQHGGWMHNRPECIVPLKLRGEEVYPFVAQDEESIPHFFYKWKCEGCHQVLLRKAKRK